MKTFLRTITAAIVIAAAALTSCMKTEEIVPEVTSSDAISFGTFVDQTTKGTIYHTSDMQESGFGLMGFHTYQKEWSDESVVRDYIMYNQLVEYNTETKAWYYSPVKYWSNITGDKYSFFAYAPYNTSTAANGNISVTSNTYAGIPVVSFKVDDAALDMVDFVAGQEVDITQTEDVVRFDLKHQLTRVSFSAKTNVTTNEDKNTDATYVIVKDMDIVATSNFYQSGDYTFDLDNSTVLHEDHEQDGVWSNLVAFSSAYDFSTLLAVTNTAIGNYYKVSGSSIEDLSYTTVDGYTETGVRVANTDASEVSLFTEGQYLFLLPPNGQEGIAVDGDISVTVSYDIVTADSALAAGYSVYATKTATVALPAEALKQGRAYDILLTFDLASAEIKVAGNVILWDESEIDDYGVTTGYDDDAEVPEPTYTPSIAFTSSTTAVETGASTTFVAEVTGNDPAVTYTYTYTVNGVAFYGEFTPTEAGTYVIVATATGSDESIFTVETTVVVTDPIVYEPTIKFITSSDAMLTGATATFEAKVSDNDPAVTYTYAYTANGVAFDGKFSPTEAGTYAIVATATGSDESTLSVETSVVVTVPVTITIKTEDGFTGSASYKGTVGGTFELFLVTTGIDDESQIVWASGDEAYLTVDQNGVVTIVKLGGPVTITATYGDVSGSIAVTTSTFNVTDPTTGEGND